MLCLYSIACTCTVTLTPLQAFHHETTAAMHQYLSIKVVIDKAYVHVVKTCSVMLCIAIVLAVCVLELMKQCVQILIFPVGKR